MSNLGQIVRKALNEADSRICRHENTHRGGAIWEICDDCGQQWADDRGGRKADKWPDLLSDALDAIANVELKYLDLPFSDAEMARLWGRAQEYAKPRANVMFDPGWRREKAEAEMALAEFARLRLAKTYGAQT